MVTRESLDDGEADIDMLPEPKLFNLIPEVSICAAIESDPSMVTLVGTLKPLHIPIEESSVQRSKNDKRQSEIFMFCQNDN